jgi:hypothetical protein
MKWGKIRKETELVNRWEMFKVVLNINLKTLRTSIFSHTKSAKLCCHILFLFFSLISPFFICFCYKMILTTTTKKTPNKTRRGKDITI